MTDLLGQVSVLSVLAKAPSVVPVLLFDGPPEHPLAAWLRDKGVTVLVHALSFKEPMMAAATELYRWQTTTWLATFSYFDIGLVADELRHRTQVRPSARAQLCFQYIYVLSQTLDLHQEVTPVAWYSKG